MSVYVGTVTNGSVINVGTLLCGDANGDNTVNLSDFYVIVSNYGISGAQLPDR